MVTQPLVVYCVDVGSVSTGKFAWARQEHGRPEADSSQDMRYLGTRVATDLDEGRSIALGFECPLFVPIHAEPQDLLKSRPGEGTRP